MSNYDPLGLYEGDYDPLGLNKNSAAKSVAQKETVASPFTEGLKRGASGYPFEAAGIEPEWDYQPEKFLDKTAMMAGKLISDLPAMVAGFGGGTIVGSPVGGTMAAFALPSALETSRRTIAQGQGGTFEAVKEIGKESAKSAAVGAITHGAGKFATAVMPTSKIAPVAGEYFGLTIGGSAVEGELPKTEDWLLNALFIGALRTGRVTSELVNGVTQKNLNNLRETQRANTPANMQPTVRPDVVQSEMAKMLGNIPPAKRESLAANMEKKNMALAMKDPAFRNYVEQYPKGTKIEVIYNNFTHNVPLPVDMKVSKNPDAVQMDFSKTPITSLQNIINGDFVPAAKEAAKIELEGRRVATQKISEEIAQKQTTAQQFKDDFRDYLSKYPRDFDTKLAYRNFQNGIPAPERSAEVVADKPYDFSHAGDRSLQEVVDKPYFQMEAKEAAKREMEVRRIENEHIAALESQREAQRQQDQPRMDTAAPTVTDEINSREASRAKRTKKVKTKVAPNTPIKESMIPDALKTQPRENIEPVVEQAVETPKNVETNVETIEPPVVGKYDAKEVRLEDIPEPPPMNINDIPEALRGDYEAPPVSITGKLSKKPPASGKKIIPAVSPNMIPDALKGDVKPAKGQTAATYSTEALKFNNLNAFLSAHGKGNNIGKMSDTFFNAHKNDKPTMVSPKDMEAGNVYRAGESLYIITVDKKTGTINAVNPFEKFANIEGTKSKVAAEINKLNSTKIKEPVNSTPIVTVKPPEPPPQPREVVDTVVTTGKNYTLDPNEFRAMSDEQKINNMRNAKADGKVEEMHKAYQASEEMDKHFGTGKYKREGLNLGTTIDFTNKNQITPSRTGAIPNISRTTAPKKKAPKGQEHIPEALRNEAVEAPVEMQAEQGAKTFSPQVVTPETIRAGLVKEFNQSGDYMKVISERNGNFNIEYRVSGQKPRGVTKTREGAMKLYEQLKAHDKSLNDEAIKKYQNENDSTLYSNPLQVYAKKLKTKIVDPILNLTTKDNEYLSDLIARKLQDTYQSLYLMEKDIANLKGLPELEHGRSTYKAEEVMSSIAGTKLDLIERGVVDPLDKLLVPALSSKSITVEDIHHYLWMKHATGRNNYLQSKLGKFDTPFKKFNESPSGVSAEQVKKWEIELAPKESILRPIAEQVWKINRLDLKLKKDYGLINERGYQEKLNNPDFWYYVPMTGKEGVDAKITKGSGLSIKSGWTAATGRRSLPTESPLLRSVAQLEQTVIRGEKNRVGNLFLKEIQQGLKEGYFNENNFKIDASEQRVMVDKKTGEFKLTNVSDWFSKEQDTSFVTMVDGKAVLISMPNHPLLARAMSNLGAEKSSMLLDIYRVARVPMRYLASIKTSLSPEFAFTNPIRDMLTSVGNIAIQDSKVMAMKIARDTLSMRAMAGMYKAMKWDNTTPWAKEAIELREMGGTMSFFNMADMELREKRLENKVKLAAGSTPHQLVDAFRSSVDFFSNIVSAGENGVKVATYKNLKEHYIRQGMDVELAKQKAASIAKNINVNFNRSGEWGKAANLSYLFFNANVQGSARLLKAMKDNPERFAKYTAAIVAVGMGSAYWNRYALGKDEDGLYAWDKIPDDTKARNLIVAKPSTTNSTPLQDRYYKVPLGYGYNFFHAIGLGVDAMMYNTQKKAGDVGWDITSAAFDAFNPMGSTKNIVSMLSPTITDPIFELGFNRNYADSPLMPEQPAYAAKKPDSELYFSNVSDASKEAANLLNKAGGGNEYWSSGALDVSPESIDYLYNYFTGGVGDFPKRLIELAHKAYNGKRILPEDIPIWRKFAGSGSDYANKTTYTEFVNTVKKSEEEYEGTGKTRNPLAVGLAQRAKESQKRISEISHEVNELRKTKMDEKRKSIIIDTLNREADQIRMQFNKEYIQATQPRKQSYQPDNAL